MTTSGYDILDLIDALSASVNEGLSNAGWPRLAPWLDGQPGKIIIANKHQLEEFMPPRIVMVPSAGDWAARSSSRGTASTETNTARPDAEGRATYAMRSIMTEGIVFETSCWGIARDDMPNSAALDFSFTRALYCQLVASLQGGMAGNYQVSGGTWRQVPNVQRVGREYVFNVTLFLPVFAELPPSPEAVAQGAVAGLPFVPPGTTPQITDIFATPDGATGPGCE